MDLSLPGSSVHGIFQVRILDRVAISSSRGIFLIQRSNPHLLCLLHCRWIIYPVSHRGSPEQQVYHNLVSQDHSISHSSRQSFSLFSSTQTSFLFSLSFVTEKIKAIRREIPQTFICCIYPPTSTGITSLSLCLLLSIILPKVNTSS